MAISNSGVGIRPGVCTSSTRPTAPYVGQKIFETDTKNELTWDGTAWSKPWNQPWGQVASAKVTTTNSSITAEVVRVTAPTFTAVANRLYKITYYEPQVSMSATGGSFMVTYIRLTNTSGTLYQQAIIQGASNNFFMNTCTYTTLSAGSTVIIGSIASGSGTGAATSTSTNPAWILVEDMGPS